MEEAIERAAAGGFSVKAVLRFMVILPAILLPLLLAGARPWFWAPVAAIFLLGVAVSLAGDWSSLRNRPLANGWVLIWGLILLYPFLQLVPIPMANLLALDPPRAVWIERANAVAHMSSGASSITYVPLITLFSGFWWIFLAGYGLVFSKTAGAEKRPEWFFRVLFILAGFEAFYGLLQVLIPSLGVLGEAKGAGLARGTFVNRNHYAAFLGMAWPLMLVYLLGMGGSARSGAWPSDTGSFQVTERQRQVRQKQWFLGFVIGLVLLALFFSQSRCGIMGSLVALTVLVSFKSIRRKSMLILVLGCWAVMLGYGSIIGFDGILARFDMIEESAPSRFMLWQDTMHMIKDHPWLGTGLGSFATVFRLYQTHLGETLQASHAHSDYLELAVELGVPLAAVLVLAVWGYWWRVAWRLRSWEHRFMSKGQEGRDGSKDIRRASERERRQEMLRKAEAESEPGSEAASVGRADLSGMTAGSGKYDRERHLMAVGALAGSAAFLCHSLVEFNWQIPANQLYFVILLVLMRFKGLSLSSRN